MYTRCTRKDDPHRPCDLRNERGLLLTTTTRTGIHDAPPGLKVRIVAKRRPIANSIICTADAVRDRLHRDRKLGMDAGEGR